MNRQKTKAKPSHRRPDRARARVVHRGEDEGPEIRPRSAQHIGVTWTDTKAQAEQLGNPRMHRAQRQTLAAQIERTQGNQHLQRVMGSVHRQPTREHALSQRTMVQRKTGSFAERYRRRIAQLRARIRREVSWTRVATEDLGDPTGRRNELRIYHAKTSGTPWTVRYLVWCLSARRHQNTMPQYYVLTPSHGHKLELLYPGLKKESYAPVYQSGRFYILKNPRGRYYKLETYFRNVPYLRKEAKRRKHAQQEVRGQESRLKSVFGRLWPSAHLGAYRY